MALWLIFASRGLFSGLVCVRVCWLVQIHQFLVQRAHPRAIANPPVVAENVVDQLHLWEVRSKQRLQPCAHTYPSAEHFSRPPPVTTTHGGLVPEMP